MEVHPEKISSDGVVRRSGEVTPFNAGDAIAAVCEMYGNPIPSQWRARLGKQAKELLDDGFKPNLVVAAMLTAVRMARPHLVTSFVMEMQNAQTGQTIDWTEYRRRLHALRTTVDPSRQRILDALRKEFA
jgi:hypothetical protein